MNNLSGWMQQKLRLGWLALSAGLVVGLIGLSLERIWVNPGFNTRIITGIGIFLIGIGAAYLLRYRVSRSDAGAARRMQIEERDERVQLLKARAGQRAYLASALLTYILLMWVSFADNGSLPEVSGDALWVALAGAFLLPLLVYLISVVYDQNNH